MQGLLADANVQGHLPYLQNLLKALALWPLLTQLNLRVARFPDVNLAPELDDRSLWNFCQNEGWVLFTDNRNHDGPDSLGATLADSWREGLLPVLTLSNKGRFEHDRGFAERVASDVAEILFGIAEGQDYRDRARIYVPLQII
jgi:hypothetical protein